MKSIEEKAKAYDEALEKATIAYKDEDRHQKATLERIFPQLKESEDEKVRKSIINLVIKSAQNGGMALHKWESQQMIAWLEKQGKPIDKIVKRAMNEKQRVLLTETNGDANIDWDTRSLQDVKLLLEYGLDYIKKLEKQGEQNPIKMISAEESLGIDSATYNKIVDECIYGEQKLADKVEPKFKVGDWVVNNNGEPQLSQVISRSWPDSKIKRATNNLEMFINTATLDRQYHLWTIQDAKDGDILATPIDVLIFKNHLPKNGGVSYCHYTSDSTCNQLNYNENNNWYFGEEAVINPATKEQRDLLFQKMKEAGYEWDAEKKELKELKKTEHNPAWSEEDENRINRLIAYFEDKESFTAEDDIMYANWLKFLKDRVQSQPKQKWSEEDEERIKNIISVLDVQVCWNWATGKKGNPYQKEIDWLKFLEYRV